MIDRVSSDLQVNSLASTMSNDQLAAQFSNIVKGIQEQVDASAEKDVQGFISSADRTADNKVSSEELAEALGILPAQAMAFVDTFNTTGDTDKALDNNELSVAINRLQAPAEAGGEEAAGSESGGTPEASAAGAASGGPSSDFISLLARLLDANGDGVISEEEWRAFVEKYDRNGDGKLDKEELTEGLKAEAEAKGLSAIISEADVDALFQQGDLNGDGLDAEELTQALAANGQKTE